MFFRYYLVLLTIVSLTFANAHDVSSIMVKSGSRGVVFSVMAGGLDVKSTFLRKSSNECVITVRESDYLLDKTLFNGFSADAPVKSVEIKSTGSSVTIRVKTNFTIASSIRKKATAKGLLFLLSTSPLANYNWQYSNLRAKESQEISPEPITGKQASSGVQNSKVSSPVEKLDDYLTAEDVVIVKNSVNFRRDTSMSSGSNIICALENGTKAKLVKEEGSWLKIITVNSGKIGWVYSTMARVEEPEKEGDFKKDIIGEKKPEVAPKSVPKVVPKTVAVVEEEKKRIMKDYRVFGRDPFLPLDRCDFLQPDLPNVELLTLVGILYDDMDRVALVESSEGSKTKSFTLRENSPVQNGRVLKIEKDRVIFLITDMGISHQFVIKFKKEIED